MDIMLTRQGWADALIELGKTNENVVVLDADLAKSTLTGQFKEQFPDRFFDLGIAEQDELGTAAGLSLTGKIPFVCTYGVFVAGRAWEQIRTTICYSHANVKIAGAHGGISVGPDGATHQALEDISIMRVLPNMTVLVPCDYYETKKAILAMAEIDGPCYVRFGREKVPVVTDENSPFEIGKANIMKEGNDVTIICCGIMLYESLEAAKVLENEGIQARVINMHTIKPLDREMVLKAAKETGAIVTAEEHQIYGGLGSAIAEVLVREHPVPMELIGIQDTFGESGSPEELMTAYGIKQKDIYKAVKKVMPRKRTSNNPLPHNAMKTATRMSRLGTETAYAVSAAASEFAARGNKMYPFHLGDMNIITPLNIIDATKKALDEGKTGYCPAAGIKELREAMAEDINKTHGTNYTWENVSIQSGGKPVIGKFLMTLMEEGDEVLYPSPGYPIFESQIDFLQGVGKPYRYIETPEGFKMDMDYFKSLITPKTTCLIYNNYQNPMGVTSSDEEMAEIAKIAVDNNLAVLADEAYFDITYDIKPQSIVSLPGMEERTMILYTFSKKFAMTGWRLGAAIGPKDVIELINKINTNDEACTTHFIQIAGIEALKGDLSEAKRIVEVLKTRLDAILEILDTTPGVKAYRPNATFYLFVNVTEAMKKMGISEVEEFRKHMLEKTGVSFCSREHFGRPMPGETEKYIRFAYSGIDIDQIQEGLGKFKEYIASYF